MHEINHADFVHIYADIEQILNRRYADHHKLEYLAHFSFVISGNFLYSAVFSPRRDVKGTDPCLLLPGTSTGREAGRPRVVWQILSIAISGGGHSHHTAACGVSGRRTRS
jgi:hypothetical protein